MSAHAAQKLAPQFHASGTSRVLRRTDDTPCAGRHMATSTAPLAAVFVLTGHAWHAGLGAVELPPTE